MAGARRYRGATKSQKVERRATWVLEQWAAKPSLRRSELVDRLRTTFECGIGAADEAIQRAYSMFAELKSDASLPDRIAHEYLSIAEEARRAKDWRAATKALDSLRLHLGIGAPERVEHSGAVALTKRLEDLSDEELALAARLDGGRAG